MAVAAVFEGTSKDRVKVMQIPLVRSAVLMNYFLTFGVTQLEAVFAFLMMDKFGYDARHVASFLEEHKDRAPFGVIIYNGEECRLVAERIIAIPLAIALGTL